jgi:predicted TIM-barrel fold metal-dependent hydrolase
VETLGTGRIVFGSDHPIAEDYLDRALKILESEVFSDEERERIGRANAEELFTRPS